MKKALFMLFLLFTCTACDEPDNSLACTTIVIECEDAIKDAREYGKTNITLFNECFEAAKNYDCDMHKFKIDVFGKTQSGLKSYNAK